MVPDSTISQQVLECKHKKYQTLEVHTFKHSGSFNTVFFLQPLTFTCAHPQPQGEQNGTR